MVEIRPLVTRDAGDLMHHTVILVLISLPAPVADQELHHFMPTWFRIRSLEEDVEPVNAQLPVTWYEGKHVAAEPDAEVFRGFFTSKTALEAVPGIWELVPDVEVPHTRAGKMALGNLVGGPT